MPEKPESKPAPEEKAAAPAAASGGGIKAFLPLIVVVVAMPALAFAMTNFVLLPKLQKGLGIAPGTAAKAEEAKGETGDKKETVSMNKLLVNVAGTMGSHYLQVSLSIEGTGANLGEKVKSLEPKLKDMATGILETKTLADLEKPGARNLIRSELLSGFNNILGSNAVQDIYFTDFAIQ